jgi:PAS domain S-box-containing protein
MIREKIRKKEIEEKLQKEHAELKWAEKATNLAHAELNQIFNGTTDAMRVIDKDFNVLRVNETLSTLSGISKDESVGKKCYGVLYSSLCHTPSCPLTRILCGEERVECEVEKERKDGIRIHCILTATPFRDHGGELIGIVEDFKEITGYKRVEEALRESEEKYRTLIESSLTGIFIHQDGKYVFVNNRFAEIHGYTPEELLGKEYWTLIHPDEREALRQIVSKRLKGKIVPQRYEVRRLKKDGGTIYCEIMAALIEYRGRPAVMGNIIDITERKQAEEALREREARLAGILGAVTDHISMIDAQHNIVWANDIAKQLFGLDLVGKKCYTAYHRRDKVCDPCIVEKTLADGKNKEHETEVIMAGGKQMNFWCTSSVVAWYPDGRPKLVIEVSRDITERKQAEETLRIKNNAIESSINAIVFADLEGNLTYVNKSFLKMWGYDDSVLGKPFVEFWQMKEKASKVVEILRAMGSFLGELVAKRKDGSLFYVQLSASMVTDEAGKPIRMMASFIDTTERKQAEETLQESEKKLRFLSSHLLTAQERERRRISIELHDELGQALMLLKLKLRSIERNLRTDQTEVRQDCEDTLLYIDQVIKNVRRLSRDLSPSILDDLGLLAAIRWLIDDCTKYYNIKTSLDIEDINNLFSREAQIIIYRIFQESLTNIGKHAQATCVSVVIKKRGGNVSFIVKDDGKGFDVEQVQGRDSTEKGLGLAAMDERARMLGGFFYIRSQDGKGTEITFTIPVDNKGGS